MSELQPIVVIYDKDRVELERFDSFDAFTEDMNKAIEKYQGCENWFYRQVPHWRNHKGETTPLCDLEMAHLVNIVKFFFAAGQIPPREVFGELQFRGYLQALADWVPAQDGYISPAKLNEIIEKEEAEKDATGTDTPSDNTEDNQPLAGADDGGSVPSDDSAGAVGQ